MEVGDEDFVLAAVLVMGFYGGKEITGNKFSALMNQLVEGMLTIGAGFTP
jgi:hypothetical protein